MLFHIVEEELSDGSKLRYLLFASEVMTLFKPRQKYFSMGIQEQHKPNVVQASAKKMQWKLESKFHQNY